MDKTMENSTISVWEKNMLFVRDSDFAKKDLG